MKKILMSSLILLTIVACSPSVVEPKKDTENFRLVSEDITDEYEVIEEKTDDLNIGEREVVLKGADGKYVVVYKVLEDESKEFLNDWTYETRVNEIVRVGTKGQVKTETLKEIETVDRDNVIIPQVKPEENLQVKPEAKPENKPVTKPETKPENKPAEKPYIVAGEIGNLGELFKTIEEARAFGNSVISDGDKLDYYQHKLNIKIAGWSMADVRYSDDSHMYGIEFYE